MRGISTLYDWLLLEEPGLAKVERRRKLRNVGVASPADRMFDGEDDKLKQKIANNDRK